MRDNKQNSERKDSLNPLRSLFHRPNHLHSTVTEFLFLLVPTAPLEALSIWGQLHSPASNHETRLPVENPTARSNIFLADTVFLAVTQVLLQEKNPD